MSKAIVRIAFEAPLNFVQAQMIGNYCMDGIDDALMNVDEFLEGPREAAAEADDFELPPVMMKLSGNSKALDIFVKG